MADQNFINRLQQIQSQNQGKTTLPSTPAPNTQPIPTQQPRALQPTAVSPATTPSAPEDPNATPQGKIFTGNWFQKLLDIPQIPAYAYAGFLKGGYNEINKEKAQGTDNAHGDLNQYISNLGTRVLEGLKNVPSGIMNRTTFSPEKGNVDVAGQLGIQNPAAKTAYNLGLSLSVPQLPVGKILKLTGATKVISKAGELTADALRGIEPVAKAIETVNPYFRNPEFGAMVQKADEAMQTRLNDVYKLVQNSTKNITPEEQRVVGTVLENNAELLPQYKEKLQPIVDAIRTFSDQVGQEAVNLGLLSQEGFDAYKGKYMTHIWQDAQKGISDFSKGSSVVPKIATQFYEKRKGAEGYVQEFGPAVFKGLGTEVKNNEIAKLYTAILDKFGVPVENVPNLLNPEKYTYAPDVFTNPNMKEAFGKVMIPKEVADYLTELNTKKNPGNLEKVYSALLDFWKKGKTIYNPAYHVRNNVSNQILTDMSTGEGIVPTVVGAIESGRQLAGKGDQKFVQAAQDVGLIGKQNFGEMFGQTLETAGLTQPENKVKKVLGTVDKTLTGFQNKSEETAKLNVFKSWLYKLADQAKITVEEALQNPEMVQAAKDKAETAIFSPYKISSKERGLVKKLGIPFYSFTRQAVPFVGKTYLDNPGAITQYDKYKTAIEGLTPGDTNQKKPDYAQNAIRLPVKNSEGKNYTFDPSYIYPFGSIGEDSMAQGRLPLGLSLNPFTMEIAQQMFNKDLYYNQPIAKSNIPDKALKQRIEHAVRTIAPQLYSTIGVPVTGLPESSGKLYGAVTGQPDFAGRTRSPVSAILDAFGFKNSVLRPEDQAQFDAKDKKSKIKSIQSERRTIMMDKRIPPEQKQILLNQLNDVMQQTLAN